MYLINADALIDKIPNPYEKNEVARWVYSMPTIEPEQKRGKWEEHGEPNEYGEYTLWYYTCSRCGAVGIPQFNYCPNCGADMRDKVV